MKIIINHGFGVTLFKGVFLILSLFFLATNLDAQPTHEGDIKAAYLKYYIRPGETLYRVLYQLQLYPIGGKEGSLNKTIRINSRSIIGKNGELLVPAGYIYLPARSLPKRDGYSIDANKVLTFSIPPRSRKTRSKWVKRPKKSASH